MRWLFAERFPQLMPWMPELATEFFSRRPNPLVTIRCSPWFHQDRVVLVGDAAHALVPFYGQGINAGFEDRATLDECLTTHEGAWGPLFRLRRKLERRVNGLYPDKNQSLYSMSSFSPMSYVEALKKAQEQQALIEQLLLGRRAAS